MGPTPQALLRTASRGAAAAVVVVALAAGAAGASPPAGLRAYPLDVHKFAVLERDSGPVSYYSIIEDPADPFIRGVYRPPLETVTLFADVGDAMRNGVERIRFRWRPWVHPVAGDECIEGRGDASANIYIVWKRGWRWYSLKLIWSSAGKLGITCRSTRNALVASDSIIIRTGLETGEWYEEEIDPSALFRAHFEGGNPDAQVPELQGIGILTDGDQTHTAAAADFGGFVLYKRSAGAAEPPSVSSSSRQRHSSARDFASRR